MRKREFIFVRTNFALRETMQELTVVHMNSALRQQVFAWVLALNSLLRKKAQVHCGPHKHCAVKVRAANQFTLVRIHTAEGKQGWLLFIVSVTIPLVKRNKDFSLVHEDTALKLHTQAYSGLGEHDADETRAYFCLVQHDTKEMRVGLVKHVTNEARAYFGLVEHVTNKTRAYFGLVEHDTNETRVYSGPHEYCTEKTR